MNIAEIERTKTRTNAVRNFPPLMFASCTVRTIREPPSAKRGKFPLALRDCLCRGSWYVFISVTPFYEDENVVVYIDPRGFVEWIAHEGRCITIREVRAVHRLLAALGKTRGRALVNRRHRYVHPDDYMIYDMSEVEGIRAERVAYYAPTTRDQVFSHVIALTTLRNVQTRVFDDRDEAIAWLLADDVTARLPLDAR